jgi:hypothetical protein
MHGITCTETRPTRPWTARRSPVVKKEQTGSSPGGPQRPAPKAAPRPHGGYTTRPAERGTGCGTRPTWTPGRDDAGLVYTSTGVKKHTGRGGVPGCRPGYQPGCQPKCHAKELQYTGPTRPGNQYFIVRPSFSIHICNLLGIECASRRSQSSGTANQASTKNLLNRGGSSSWISSDDHSIQSFT